MYAIGAGGARGLSEILDLIGNEASSITGLLGHKTLAGINEASLAKSHAAQGNEKG
jgi:isopentenyl diphosphate isomerase/L-lactate dehydrogenase-like FMN-dependent dehydrogenase